jgi:hypothetical protein
MCIISKNWEVCLSKQKKKLKLGGCNRGITSGAPLISHMLSDISILPPCNGGCKCVNSKNWEKIVRVLECELSPLPLPSIFFPYIWHPLSLLLKWWGDIFEISGGEQGFSEGTRQNSKS